MEFQKAFISFPYSKIAASSVCVAVNRFHAHLRWQINSVLLTEDPAVKTIWFVLSCFEATTCSLKHSLKAFNALNA